MLLLGLPNYRQWHTGWGATAAERAGVMAGDTLIVRPHFVATRAITIDAPREAVWPWIIQMGHGRAGWYSYDLLDNRARHGAQSVEARWQRIRVGDPVRMSARVDDHTAFRVRAFVPYQLLVWAKPDATWSWRLEDAEGGTTRLVTRIRARYEGATALVGVPLMEIGDYPMMRRCLLGIKARAEHPSNRSISHTGGSR
jgi:hypothetical protein